MKRFVVMDSMSGSHGSAQPYLDTDLLTTFIAVVDCGGFTAAASQLHKTQSAVSLRIRKLEEITGVPLLLRTSRQLALTSQGTNFLVHARRIVHMHAQALAEVASRGHQGVIRFGVPEDCAVRWASGILKHFRERHPRVRTDLHCLMSTELLDRLDRGELDLVLAVRHGKRRDGRVIRKAPLAWMAAPAFRSDPDAALPLALFPEGCVYRTRAIQALLGCGRRWEIVYTSQSPTGMRIAVEQGAAVTVATPETAPVSWRVLGKAEGLPPLASADLELYRSPAAHHAAVDALEEIAEAEVAGREC